MKRFASLTVALLGCLLIACPEPPERGGFAPPSAGPAPPERGGLAPGETESPPPNRGGLAPGATALPDGPVAPGSSRGGFAPGSGLADRLWEGRADYSCPARPGEQVTISVSARSPGLDPQVWLVDPYGNVEAYDDDGGGGGASRIYGHPIRLGGVYTIHVESHGLLPGDILLSVQGSCYQ